MFFVQELLSEVLFLNSVDSLCVVGLLVVVLSIDDFGLLGVYIVAMNVCVWCIAVEARCLFGLVRAIGCVGLVWGG